MEGFEVGVVELAGILASIFFNIRFSFCDCVAFATSRIEPPCSPYHRSSESWECIRLR